MVDGHLNIFVFEWVFLVEAGRHLEETSWIISSIWFLEIFRHLENNPSNRAPHSQTFLILIFTMFFHNFTNFINIRVWCKVMNFQELLNNAVTFIEQLLTPYCVLGLDISETSELVEVPSEGVSSMLESLVSSADETSSFDHVVTTIVSWGWEILVDRVDFEVLEWVDWSWTVLPYVPYNVIEISSFKKVNRVRWKPVFHVYVPSLSM